MIMIIFLTIFTGYILFAKINQKKFVISGFKTEYSLDNASYSCDLGVVYNVSRNVNVKTILVDSNNKPRTCTIINK